jgi:NAD(P)-dependent dehydrogenase (short-subunit alcohol dehydrogenase family)
MSTESMRGRVAVITGAAQGLGAAIAETLASAGANVALLDRDEDQLNSVLADLKRADDSQRHFALAADLSREDDVRDAVREIETNLGRIDILVNSAGGSGSQSVRDIEDVSAELWAQTIGNNLTSTFLCCKYVVPVMRRNGYGRIVNFSSGLANGQAGPLGPVGARLPYATAKAAITAFSKQLAKDLAGTGITVNTIAPGLIVPAKSGRVRERFESLAAEERTAILGAIPMGRAGEADEISSAILYLVSEHAGFTSGALLSVDGAAS